MCRCNGLNELFQSYQGSILTISAMGLLNDSYLFQSYQGSILTLLPDRYGGNRSYFNPIKVRF
jgi:hypothetical protein